MWMGRIVEWNNGSAARLEKASLGDPEYEGRAYVAPRAGFVALCFELCFLAIWQSHCGMGDVAPINIVASQQLGGTLPRSSLTTRYACPTILARVIVTASALREVGALPSAHTGATMLSHGATILPQGYLALR